MDARADAPAPLTAAELDAYREQADAFLSELEEETYRHFAGLKDRLELEPIYERHGDLATLERARAIGAAVDGARTREVWRFACERYIGGLTRELAERTAALESDLTATVDGAEIAYRMLSPTLANEPDRGRRERIDEARRQLAEEHLNPLREDAAAIVRQASVDLGGETYVDLYRRFGFPLDALADQCRAFLEDTRGLWESAGDRLFRAQAGVPLSDARRSDVGRVFRAASWDPVFPRDAMVPALEATLADLGIDLGRQTNVQLDLEERPRKVPRAYCFPIEVPGRIVLMIQPIGGSWDWHSLFHEAGHSEHFAHTSRELAFEQRRLGDDAVTEGWAFLFDHLVDNPAWLTRRLDVPRVDEVAAEGAALLLFFIRRYAAKLLYELELHSTDDLPSMRDRYVELLGDALEIEPAPEDYILDVDEGFYASSYLRAWGFEAQMSSFLQEEFGSDWFRRREAGSLLRELWTLGQEQTADELLLDVAGLDVQLDAAAERIRFRFR